MPITTEDIEREFQEECARKKQYVRKHHDIEAAWIPQKCRLVLAIGVCFALVVVFVPIPEFLMAREELPPLLNQISDSTKKRALNLQRPPATDTEVEARVTEELDAEKTSEWVMAIRECKGDRAVNCDELCADEGLQCDKTSLANLKKGESIVKSAFKTAGATCETVSKVDIASAWDGPHAYGGHCTYTTSQTWIASCSVAPPCGWNRICACRVDSTSSSSSSSRSSPPRKFRVASRMPNMWYDVAGRLPQVVPGDWTSETIYLDRLLRQFGKLTPEYKGHQRLTGFQHGKIFDEKGMFAFDDTIRSVAIDVGAATNPLSFDIQADASQVAFFVEPVQWKTLEESLERDHVELYKSSNCVKAFSSPPCSKNRVLVFPSAVSSVMGTASFHVTKNAYCGSLENFAVSAELAKSTVKEVRDIFDQCYKDAGQQRQVPTISLKSVIERIPKHIAVKYVKIDAQGHDFKVLLSAGDQITRIEYVRFEMQVDPRPGYKLVKDIQSFAEVLAQMEGFGFKPAGKTKEETCHYDGASKFSLVVKEMECVFCKTPPCIEHGRAPMGPKPSKEDAERNYVQPALWQPPTPAH